AYSHFERLSALDDSFLEIENGTSHMHIGAVAVFEGGPLATPDGGVDIERGRAPMGAGLHPFPRFARPPHPPPAPPGVGGAGVGGRPPVQPGLPRAPYAPPAPGRRPAAQAARRAPDVPG